MLRLAYIADPNSIHTRRWIGYFASRGHDVHLLIRMGTEVAPGLDPRISVHRYAARPPVPVPLLGLATARRALRSLLQDLHPEILHALSVRRYGWQAALSGFHPLVVSPWGSDLLRVGSLQVRARWWNRRALRLADLVTVSSEGMRNAAIRSGAPPGRIHLVHHGVDTEAFAPGAPDDAFRSRLATQGVPIVLAPRAIRRLYRHDVMIDALALLAADGLRPVLIMSGLLAHGEHLAALRARADDLGVGQQLRVVDRIDHSDLPDFLRTADVVVSIPETDSFPVTLLEAMACGRPVVASDLPAVAPVLRGISPLAAACIAPVGDSVLTARAVRRALDLSSEERERLGDSFRAYVIEHADYATNMASMEELYRRLAASH